MNPQIRVFLWVGLGVLLYLNAQAWMKAYPPGGPPKPAESSVVAPAANPADGLAAELPTVSGEAVPAPAPSTSVPDAAAGDSAAAG
jgi:hypothetical protein